jgi:hypothetical protein
MITFARAAGRPLCVAAIGLMLCASSAAAKTFAGVVPDVGAGGPNVLSVLRTGTSAVAARAGRLPYQGGPVLHSNRTHVVFWQPPGARVGYPPGYQAVVQRFMRDVAADSHRPTNVYSLTGQYRDAGGPAGYDSTFAGALVDTDPLPRNGCIEPLVTGPGWLACLSDAQIENELRHVISADKLPTTSRDIYFAVLPDGLGVCEDIGPEDCSLGGTTQGSFCAYHSTSPDARLLYAVIPFNAVEGHCSSDNPRPNTNPADPALSTISHEHNETITDPLGTAWIDAAGNEEADLCIDVYGASVGGSGEEAWNAVIHGDHYYLQSEWSNWTGACERRTQADSVSFGTTTRPSVGHPVSFSARAHAAHGQISAFNWFFGDGRSGRGRSTSHVYGHAGSYRVVLRTTDSAGLWAYAARTVAVRR